MASSLAQLPEQGGKHLSKQLPDVLPLSLLKHQQEGNPCRHGAGVKTCQ